MDWNLHTSGFKKARGNSKIKRHPWLLCPSVKRRFPAERRDLTRMQRFKDNSGLWQGRVPAVLFPALICCVSVELIITERRCCYKAEPKHQREARSWWAITDRKGANVDVFSVMWPRFVRALSTQRVFHTCFWRAIVLRKHWLSGLLAQFKHHTSVFVDLTSPFHFVMVQPVFRLIPWKHAAHAAMGCRKLTFSLDQSATRAAC